MFQDLHITPKREASIMAVAMIVILTLGTLASIAGCFVALWAVVALFSLCLQSIIECLTAIGSTFQAADPLIRFLILVAIGYVLFRLFRRFGWRI